MMKKMGWDGFCKKQQLESQRKKRKKQDFVAGIDDGVKSEFNNENRIQPQNSMNCGNQNLNGPANKSLDRTQNGAIFAK